jgi:hypothetical protein
LGPNALVILEGAFSIGEVDCCVVLLSGFEFSSETEEKGREELGEDCEETEGLLYRRYVLNPRSCED